MRFLLFIFCFQTVYGSLSLKQKVGQVFMAPLYERELTEEGRKFFEETRLGNVIYFGFANGPFTKEQLSLLSKDLKSCIKEVTGHLPLLSIDQEGGGFNQLKEGFTHFTAQNQMLDRDEVYEVGVKVGRELKEMGITTDLAPVVDVVVRPESPLRYRSFGDHPERVVSCAGEMIKGLHESGIHAVLKHFPGLGDTEVDSHLGMPVLDKTLEEMDKLELLPFYALKEEVDAIMVGHLMVPSIDPNRCASLSPLFVEGILREKIGFDKVVITDSLVMKGALGEVNTFDEAADRLTWLAIEAFLAGSDLLIVAKLEWVNFEVKSEQHQELIARVMKGFLEAVKRGDISEERLDLSIKRILEMKGKFKGVS